MEDRVESLRVRAVRVPMAEPHRTAGGIITESPLVLVDVSTASGAEGHAMVFTYTAAALRPVAELTASFEPLVTGRDLAPEAITRDLLLRLRLLGAQGLVGMAISGIDMALWDALARRQGLALCRLLGATPRSTPAYGGIGYDGAKDCAAQAERWMKRGLRCVKAKIGYPTVREDVEVIRAVRAATGGEAEILVDYNQWLSPTEATQRLRVLDGEGIGWVEEPVVAEDYSGMACVAREAATPIQAGENWWGPLEFAKAIEAGATDLLMPDLMKVFGVTGWMDVAALASVKKLPVSCHLFPECSAHVLAATPTAHKLEYADWWNPVLKGPLEIRDGQAWPGDRPGSGIEWDEGAIARLTH